MFYKEKPTKNVLWDFRNVNPDSLLSFSYSYIEDIAGLTKQHRELRSSGKTALVVSTDIEFGLGRMYGAFAEAENLSHSVQVFRFMAEAVEWPREDD